MEATSKVTREVLDSYLRCKTKGFLTLTGRDGIKSDHDRCRIETEERQRLGATANLLLRYRDYQVADGVNLHASRLRAGVDDLILHGRFENALISMNIDALVKAESLETPGQGHYIPVLFHDGAVRAPEKALIELFALLVSELQESVPDVGLVCRSQGSPRLYVSLLGSRPPGSCYLTSQRYIKAYNLRCSCLMRTAKSVNTVNTATSRRSKTIISAS